ncbi:DUF1016 family protein [Candidatus Woesearchaeota archaeon]|nr:DUF1016 family protein [Candidatus Woesearchaeota archaeon]
MIWKKSSLGIIICKSKKRTVVEYALKASQKSKGVSTYKITPQLPTHLIPYLPSKEEIVEKLNMLEGKKR